jgi:hypothetical protein
MRTMLLAAALLATMAMPLALADDPTLTLPDAAPLGAQAADAASAVGDDAVATHQANLGEATGAVGDAQKLQVPFSRVAAIAANGGGFASRSVGAAGGLGGAGVAFVGGSVIAKVGEASAVSQAADGTGAAAVGSASQVANAALVVACAQPLTLPPDCDSSSVVGQVASAGADVAEAAQAVAPPGGAVGGAVEDALAGILDSGEA